MSPLGERAAATGTIGHKGARLRSAFCGLFLAVVSADASGQDSMVVSSDSLRALEAEYRACPDEFCAAAKLASLDTSTVAHIMRYGAEDRLVIAGIQAPAGYPWIVRFTIKPISESLYRLHLQSEKDIAHGNGVGLWSSRSVIRFDGQVRFPIRSAGSIGGGWLNRGTKEDTEGGITNSVLVQAGPTADALLFQGDSQDVLTFAMIDRIGFTYLHGSGTVQLADGTVIALPKKR